MLKEIFLDAGFSGVRPTPRATVQAFLVACHPGSRCVGEPQELNEQGCTYRQAFKTSSGEEMNVYLKPSPSGGWRVGAKSRYREESAAIAA